MYREKNRMGGSSPVSGGLDRFLVKLPVAERDILRKFFTKHPSAAKRSVEDAKIGEERGDTFEEILEEIRSKYLSEAIKLSERGSQ